jgi:hypothetical protein
MVGRDVEKALRRLGLDRSAESRLRRLSRRLLWRHVAVLLVGYKRPTREPH